MQRVVGSHAHIIAGQMRVALEHVLLSARMHQPLRKRQRRSTRIIGKAPVPNTHGALVHSEHAAGAARTEPEEVDEHLEATQRPAGKPPRQMAVPNSNGGLRSRVRLKLRYDGVVHELARLGSTQLDDPVHGAVRCSLHSGKATLDVQHRRLAAAARGRNDDAVLCGELTLESLLPLSCQNQSSKARHQALELHGVATWHSARGENERTDVLRVHVCLF